MPSLITPFPTTTGLGCCQGCGRRAMLASIGLFISTGMKKSEAASLDSSYEKYVETIHPAKPDWYEELYAETMNTSMGPYRIQVEGYKSRLFQQLGSDVPPGRNTVVELGIGTGPNLKYYATKNGITNVIGIDPNEKMEKFARSAALESGLPPSKFKFIHGVAEKLPLDSSSVDFVISTLVMCSVTNVALTLEEIRRVLKPGGKFLFIEHVAAPEGTSLRFIQEFLDPLQQLLSDGCHLSRNTLASVEAANFSSVESQTVVLKNAGLISPHAIGIAQA